MRTAPLRLVPGTRLALPPPWTLVVSATTVVILWSTVRGLIDGFQPVGDNALMELRAWDVLTGDRPLLGTWSSASVASGLDLNHPGPLLFDYFSLPVRLFGGAGGIAIGAAALNLGAVWGSVLVGRRIGGDDVALGVAVCSGILVWTLGSELLFDSWQPNVLVLPFFAFLMLIWAVMLGHSRGLPFAVAVGSLCMQAHLSYLFLVPALLVLAVVGLIVSARRSEATSHRRPIVAAIVVGVALWAQPIWEQLFGPGEGNLTRLLTSSDAEGAVHNGPAVAVRMLAAVVALPPFWGRPSYETSIPISPWVDTAGGRALDLDGLPTLPVAVLALALFGALLGAVAVIARRHGDTVLIAGVILVGVTTIVATATASITPIDLFGVVPHKVRWFWAVGALSGVILLVAMVRAIRRRSPDRAAASTWLAAGVGVLVAALALPTHRIVAGPVDQDESWPAVRSVREQLAAAGDLGSVFVDLDGLVFAEEYSWPIMAELARQGVPFEVLAEGDVRQVGEGRRFDGTADTRLYYRTGSAATTTPPGATRLAYFSAPDEIDAVAVFVEPFDSNR